MTRTRRPARCQRSPHSAMACSLAVSASPIRRSVRMPGSSGKWADHPDRAERPGRLDAEHAGGQAGLDALADRQLVADMVVELDGGTLHQTEHAAAELVAVWGERDAVDRGDLVVVERPERGDQRGDTIGLSGVFVAPGAARMEAECPPRDTIIECEAPDTKISLHQRAARVAGLIPDGACALDANLIVSTTRQGALRIWSTVRPSHSRILAGWILRSCSSPGFHGGNPSRSRT